MNITLKILILSILIHTNAQGAGMDDDPIINKFMINKLETTIGDDPTQSWNIQNWTGTDFHKIWLKSEGEAEDKEIDENELQVLYSHAISPYWDLQLGWHSSLIDEKENNAVIGFHGVAPYFFEIDSSLFISKEGTTKIEFEAEYELMLTQKLVLSPEVGAKINSNNHPEEAIGSGISETEVGLRIRYEFIREFSVHIGTQSWAKFGKTKDYAIKNGSQTRNTDYVVGLKAWY